MKKFLCIWLCCLMLLPLIACGKKEQPPAVEQPSAQMGTTTVMVYMVGSDLEAKGASGTNDMKEMLESGCDLTKNNVIVYAGGTRRWHNDNVSADAGHTMLKLTANGFESVATFEEASMGEAATLSAFLNRAHTDFPADNYALILWDHGNGPLIGYGKDMLHENDSLTLTEMKEAMANSPFAQKKLNWVGFDACLMSSLELCCLWSDYAEYLVASQEIEPAFGWNYSFLKTLGQKETTAFLTDLTSQYLTTCQDYYTERGYDQRDTTLACMDLAGVPALKDAVEALFTKVGKDVPNHFGALTNQRVSTRALGRATTGSEYDLIDLNDMAEQMKGMYAEETKAIQTAIESVVVANATNATGCCGISLYYPFYNKSYYEKTWGDVYSKLGVLPQYTAYLDAYADKWLGDELLQSVATSVRPSVGEKNEYVLELTDEQASAYAEGSYYILQKEGEGLYTKIFSSKGVVKEDNRLTANFDGNILYGKTKFDEYFIPVAEEHDTVGEQTRFSIYANLVTDYATIMDRPEDYEHKVAGHRFHISANKTTGEIKQSALVPFDEDVDTDTLVGGKLADADLSEWSEYYFLNERHRYLERFDNGVIKPVDSWNASDFYSATAVPVDDGLKFVYAPIPDGEYYLIFEIADQQGNRYCSDLLTITESGNELPIEYQPDPPIEVSWASGAEIKLLEKDGITVWMTTTQTYDGTKYSFKVQNQTEEDVAFRGAEWGYNDKVYCEDASFGYFIIPAGQTVTDEYGVTFGDAAEMGMVNDLQSLQFSFSVVTARCNKTLVYDQWCSVTLAEATTFIPPIGMFDAGGQYKEQTRGYLAKEQLLFEKDGLKAYLMGLGGDGKDGGDLRAALRFENTSEEKRYLAVKGFAFDGVYVEAGTGPMTFLPGTVSYKSILLRDTDLNEHMVTSPAKASVNVVHMQYATLAGGGGFSESAFYAIKAEKQGSGKAFKEGTTILYEENGVRIALQKTEVKYETVYWYCTVTNTSDRDIKVMIPATATVNGETVRTDEFGSPVLATDGVCGAGQQTMFIVSCDEAESLNVQFEPIVYDLTEEVILWTSEKTVQLEY